MLQSQASKARGFSLLLASAGLVLAGVAPAQSPAGSAPAENVRYTYATVLSATPVYETVRFTEPREECTEERVVYRERDSGTAGTVIGAIVGGVVGNQVGKGSGRRAATVAGAVAGGAIGRNVDRNNGPERRSDGAERRCQLVEVTREERRLSGYDVEYRLKDEVYFARLPYDPGNNLRVRVSVTPVE
jgi:uncharacterized protein YcfJ